ncbi:MAG TPA: hypothetical protein VHK69_21980, partial [Chitinophagaceae bacterium]|nr:hypothetical protein [Chitinophagaceae bacterium]
MRKHVLRLLLLYFLFELMRKVGSELPEMTRGQWSLQEFTDRNSLLLMASNFVLFFLYPLFTFLILDRHFRLRKRRALLLITLMMIGVICLRYL